MRKLDAKIKVEGIYQKTISRDMRDGFTSFLLKTEQNKVICSGRILQINDGEKVSVQGEWASDSLFGAQIKNAVVQRLPLDENGLLRLMLSGEIGFGVNTAKEIAREFGRELLQSELNEALENRLVLVRGVKRKQIQTLFTVLRKHHIEQELYDYIVKHGGIYRDYLSIYKLFGYESISMLKSTPYEVGRKSGLSFVICDSIAKENGGHSQSRQRLECGVRKALQIAASEGHTYLEKNQLIRETQRVLRNAVFPEHVSLPVINLAIEFATRSNIVRERDRYYIRSLRNSEKAAAENIARISFGKGKYAAYRENFAQEIMRKTGMVFSAEQKEAFKLLESPGIKVMLGAPGTGKTTIVRGLVEAFLIMKPDSEIVLCAPTGRAAQKLSESVGREAYTIHRLLEFVPAGSADAHRALKADLYVVDEASMINIELAVDLLSQIETGATVIFVGDNEQLPAIGAGSFLRDLSQCNLIPTVELTEVFRQKSGSLILQNSRTICMGISRLQENEDFQLVQVEDDQLLDKAVREFAKIYDREHPYEIQVLACTKEIVEHLNKLLQRAVNSQSEGIRYGGQVFKVGDKIIMNSNNYRLRYFNGDVGIVSSIVSNEYIKVNINQVEILLTLEEFEDMELGYATTVHKAQGSEYPVVFLVLPSKPRKMLRRKIIYTAITRGREKVKVFAQKATIAMAVANNEEDLRQSTLVRRIEAYRNRQQLNYEQKGAA